ncbi:cysteine hydrolase family protein [Fundidesulfovibrio agrisoli]|uniref:cysteine hydrolase family protein n=1 Tax=Fundidesulfovibrio agrisoli TaxID=2922717 RepID=UPI001FAC9AF9|nr:cysteine hydrolase family protein [Fundidesulfovibrio agrisoli]
MKTALLLIDIQKDYFPGGAMELVGAEAAAAKAARALEHFRAQGMPVFHIRHVSLRPGAGFFLPGTPGVEFHPYVAPAEGEAVIEKHFPNSFRETDLEARLRDAKVERLVIAGMMSHMCVDATTRQAFDMGFACIVLADACATRDLDFGHVSVPASHVHGAFMAALGAVYAELAGVKDLAAALR